MAVDMTEKLFWLPPAHDVDAELSSIKKAVDDAEKFERLRALAGCDLDLMQINRVDRLLGAIPSSVKNKLPNLKLALLASGTLEPLLSAIRVAALRRGLIVDI